LDVSIEELEAWLERARPALGAEGYEKLRAAIRTLGYVTELLEKKETTLAALREWLCPASTEKTDKVLKQAGIETGEKKPGPESVSQKPKRAAAGHGRHGVAAYGGAQKVKVPHASLKAGDACPDTACDGKVYLQRDPGVLVRIKGQAPIAATVGDKKYDESAASMMAMLRYGSGFPWNRLESLENSLGIPLPAATQCQIMAETAVLLQPALDELQRQAAQGEVCRRCAPWLSGRHFGPLSTLRNAEVPIPKSCGDRTVPPFLDPHEGASQSGADVLARDLVDLRIQRERVIVVHPALFHMAENRRQIVMLLQRPVGIVCAGRRHRQRAIHPGRNSLSR
jgi:hypothetical protein